MPTPSATDDTEARFEEDLERLDQGMRVLKAQYNRYFVGSAERPPRELQATLAAIIHRRSAAPGSPGRRTADYFRFNSMVSNFHVLTEMWNRNVRSLEEGRGDSLVVRRARATTATATPAATGEREVYRTCVSATTAQPGDERWQGLYASYLQAAEKASGHTASLSYQTFFDRLQDRVRQYSERTGKVELTCRVVVVDDRPVLKLGSGAR